MANIYISKWNYIYSYYNMKFVSLFYLCPVFVLDFFCWRNTQQSTVSDRYQLQLVHVAEYISLRENNIYLIVLLARCFTAEDSLLNECLPFTLIVIGLFMLFSNSSLAETKKFGGHFLITWWPWWSFFYEGTKTIIYYVYWLPVSII